MSLFILTAFIFLLLHFSDRRKDFFPIIISSLMGPLVTLSLIAIFQVPVTLITSIFLAVMVGFAGDNAVHFVLASENDLQRGIRERLSASCAVTFLMMAGGSVFLFQTLLPMKILGVLFLIGFSVNFIGDVWGLSALLEKKT